MACSLTVSSSLATSARSAATWTSSPEPSRRPGRDCANAVNAPSRPTRRMRMIVVGSTFRCSAAWRCVTSPVNNCCQIWYFSSALNGRLRRPLRRLASRGPDMLLLGPV